MGNLLPISQLKHVIQKRLVRLVAVGGLFAGAIGAPILLTGGTAEAAACGTATLAGTSCTRTGTLNLLAGPLTLTSPSALAWSVTDNGLNQSLVDTTTAQQSYLVNDATGSGDGWRVTASATTFTTGAATLPNVGTFLTFGGTNPLLVTNAPSPVCSAGATCLLPTNTSTYPVQFTTAAASPSPATIYDTAPNTGLGSIVIGGGANHDGWWLNVPANAVAGTYTSTVTLQIVSGP
jgi:hypothetical protein